MRHVLTLFDLSAAEIERIFSIAEELKAKLAQGVREPLLAGRVMALLFDKPSLRTRVSFEACMTHLGGATQFLGAEVGWGRRESIADFAGVLGQYVDVIVCRTNVHKRVEELARYSACPVINGLTDQDHPCQALADLFTLREICGELRGRTLAYVGDANNVARSLAAACAKLGVHFTIASPDGYQLDDDFVAAVGKDSPGCRITRTGDPDAAVKEADAVYTDVWTSMGQESEQARRRTAFAAYQVNGALMGKAPKDAIFLHCLPACRGEEVTDEVIDGPQSRVLQQAANRLHAQKGLLAWLLGSQH
jgi:ornithine carbamoyltransferase